MLRRIAALLLIMTSGWLLYQTHSHFLGGSDLARAFMAEFDNPYFLGPAIGGLLGLAGGLIVFFGGAGGAAIAITGGVISAGLSVYLGERLLPEGFKVWENEASVGVTILVLAAIAAVVGRD